MGEGDEGKTLKSGDHAIGGRAFIIGDEQGGGRKRICTIAEETIS